MEINIGKLPRFNLARSVNVDPQLRMQHVIGKLASEFDCVIDVGANLGTFTDFILSKNPHQKILMVEPVKLLVDKLKQKYANFPNIEIHGFAVGAKNSKGTINLANNSFQSSSILKFLPSEDIGENLKMTGKQSVEIIRLDKLLNGLSEQNIFMKIDIQGYELAALQGINYRNFRKIKAFLIECNLKNIYKGSALIEEVIYKLRKLNFFPYRIENGFGEPNFGQQYQVDILFRNHLAK